MKEIRITFELVDHDDVVSLMKLVTVSQVELQYGVTPILPIVAETEAQKFWEVVVGMGKLDGVAGL